MLWTWDTKFIHRKLNFSIDLDHGSHEKRVVLMLMTKQVEHLSMVRDVTTFVTNFASKAVNLSFNINTQLVQTNISYKLFCINSKIEFQVGIKFFVFWFFNFDGWRKARTRRSANSFTNKWQFFITFCESKRRSLLPIQIFEWLSFYWINIQLFHLYVIEPDLS